MLIFLSALVFAYGLRRARADRPRVSAKLRWVWMPLVAALLQVALNLGGLRILVGDGRFAVIAASYAIVGVWLLVNTWSQPPTLRAAGSWITAGWLTNAIAIIANRGMPVSASALARIGEAEPKVSDGNLWKHVLATPHSVLPWLGDVIAVPIPILRNVISVGDLLMLIGAIWAVQVVGFPPRAEPVVVRSASELERVEAGVLERSGISTHASSPP